MFDAMVDSKKIIQVKDDSDLLKLMINDLENASKFYKPTNYWHIYQTRFIPELLSKGLKDFRRRSSSVVQSFGATDLYPFSNLMTIPKQDLTLGIKFMQFITKTYLKFKSLQFSIFNTSKNSNKLYHGINMECFKTAESYGQQNHAKSIRDIEDTTIGNPENLFYVDNKKYTNNFLEFYVQYAYCCKFMDFDNVNTICELGSGSGRQVEVLKKLYPHLCFYLFDIAPQLYVCELYLSTVFPESVVSYRQTRNMTKMPKPEPGKIFIFGNWKIPEIIDLKYDMFWNSASFQEMEPSIVTNYLSYVNKQATKYIFLQASMRGKEKSRKKGKVGVMEQTKREHYEKGLSNFSNLDISRSIRLPRVSSLFTSYRFSFWKKNK